jgi:TRAP-type mannitol/chloroaromatic compound transport system substrate-binding protein
MTRNRLPAWLDEANDATLVPKVATPDGIIIVVAGGTAGRFTLQMTGWGGGSGTQLVTVPIRTED